MGCLNSKETTGASSPTGKNTTTKEEADKKGIRLLLLGTGEQGVSTLLNFVVARRLLLLVCQSFIVCFILSARAKCGFPVLCLCFRLFVEKVRSDLAQRRLSCKIYEFDALHAGPVLIFAVPKRFPGRSWCTPCVILSNFILHISYCTTWSASNKSCPTVGEQQNLHNL